MLKPGGLGTYIGDVNIGGGGGAGSETDMAIWGCSYYGEGGGVLDKHWIC